MHHPLRDLCLDELRSRTSVKWRAYPADVLPLWVAEMDVQLAEPITDALSSAIHSGDTGYPLPSAYDDAIIGFARTRWAWDIDPEQVVLLPDVMLGITEVLGLVTSPGDAVVVNSPVYPPFYDFVRHIDRVVVEAPLTAEHRIDMASLEQAFGSAESIGSRSAYLLCSPHNPTGTVHTRAELDAAGELATSHGARIVVDEIHAPLVYAPATQVPFLTTTAGPAAIALLSASKAWNLAGIKAAVGVAGPEAVDELSSLPEIVGHGASHLGVLAHSAAFRAAGGWLDGLLVDLDANRALLRDLLAEYLPDVRYRVPDGTYLAWLDCRALGLGDDPARAFLDRGRVALTSGLAFGTGGAGHARFNFATSAQLLEDGVRRMASI